MTLQLSIHQTTKLFLQETSSTRVTERGSVILSSDWLIRAPGSPRIGPDSDTEFMNNYPRTDDCHKTCGVEIQEETCASCQAVVS